MNVCRLFDVRNYLNNDGKHGIGLSYYWLIDVVSGKVLKPDCVKVLKKITPTIANQTTTNKPSLFCRLPAGTC